MAKGDELQAKALRDRKREDLVEELLKLRREQFNLRVQEAVGQLTRSDQVRKVRRNIARVKTVLSEQARREAK
jgi:large subunit ribosomal protein L29